MQSHLRMVLPWAFGVALWAGSAPDIGAYETAGP
jgi:hypothetical protein